MYAAWDKLGNMEPSSVSPADVPFLMLPDTLPAPPRPVRRRPGHGWLLGHVPILVWMLVVPGCGWLLLALGLLLFSWIVVHLGAPAPGKIIGVVPASVGGIPTTRVQFTYYVGSQEYSGEEAVDERASARLHVGAEVRVKVLSGFPNHPRLVEPPGQSGTTGICLLLLAVLWNAALAFVVWSYLRKPRTQRRLVREGLATAGNLVVVEAGKDRRRSREIQFAYRAPAHGLATSAAGPAGSASGTALREWQVLMKVRRKDFARAQVGMPVTVLYDPREPSRSVVYAFADYEVRPSDPAPQPQR
jgi:hypothetical protein